MSKLVDALVELGLDEKTAMKVEMVVLERFAKFYEQILKAFDESLARYVAENYPEAWDEGLVLVADGAADDPLYEALLCLFRGCLEE